MKKISKGYLQIFSIVVISIVLASSYLVTLNLNHERYFSPKSVFNQENTVTNLFTSSLASDYEYKWNSTWGTGYNDVGVEVATDSFNNIYLVGHSDTTGSDNCDIKIIKYNPSGVEQWSRNWGGINDDKASHILIDSSNNIYITGYTKSLGDTDGDVIIIKYDIMGNEIWNKTWGGPQYDSGTYILEDTSGNFYVTGQTNSFGDVDGDALLIKFDNSFEELWNVTWGGGEHDIVNKIEIGSDNYLYVVGHSDSVDSHAGYSDVVLLKYDEDGNYEWERTWGTSFDQRGSSLALDSYDNIYITGHTFGHPASSGKGHLLKYDSDGNYQWERIWGVNGEYGNYFYRIIIDDKDELYISGCTKSYGIPNNYDALLLNYDTSGNQNWYKYWAESGFEVSPGICMDSIGNIYTAGYTDTDSVGGYDTLLLKYKNILGPDISIASPISNSLYSTTAPNFNITIDDPAYDFTWYSLDGGSTNIYSNETIGTIDQTEWDKQSNGTVTITFYANNSLGIVGQAEVTVRKDILAPLITINSPSENQVCGVDAPSFDLTILEHEIDSTWYTLDYGSINVSFTGSTGTIDQTEWTKKGEELVPIRFYANDSFGNVDYSEVIVVKDLTSPVVSINSPDHYELFGKASPNFDITVTESNPDLMWYTIDSGITNITFGSLIGTIDQTEWNKQGNGTVTIVFYAKDEGGNEGYAEVIVRKDISDPIVIINTPVENELFGINAPFFNVSVIEPDFDSMWYTLDDGINNITASDFTGDISQTEWNKKNSGIIFIKFYANDTLGNKGYAEIAVEKDITDPTIQVNTPIDDAIFGYNAPSYDISITEANLDSMWCTLDNGLTNIPLSSFTGDISQTEWNKKGSGTVSIRFYANDTMGNTDYTEVIIVKDLIDPIVTIIFPNENEVFGAEAPTFEISVTELNLDTMWYTLDNGLTNIPFSSFIGTIDQTEWDKKGTGDVLIKFYASDDAGNEDSAELTVSKDIDIPIITIYSPEMDGFANPKAPIYNITVQEPNIDLMWYTFDYGVNIYYFTEFIGLIDQVEWNKYGNGSVVLRFYVSDKGGNEAFSEVLINKDIYAPIITIETPEFGEQIFDYAPIFSISIQEPNLVEFWYSLDNGNTNFTITELTGVIDQVEWKTLPDGPITIRFYAKDKAGNIDMTSVIVTKITTNIETPPPGIPGYNLLALIGVTLAVSLILAKRKHKK